MASSRSILFDPSVFRSTFPNQEKESFVFFFSHDPREAGDHAVFSNSYPSPFTDPVDKVTYAHVEQWMMAQKALYFGDHETHKQIMAIDDPQKIKRLGNVVCNCNEQKWNRVSEKIVASGVVMKFEQNPRLRTILLATKGTLVNASPDDRVWGIGLAADDPRAQDRTKWKGENRLGRILTHVRECLR